MVGRSIHESPGPGGRGACQGLVENDIVLVRRPDDSGGFCFAHQESLEEQLASQAPLQLHLLRRQERQPQPPATLPAVPLAAGARCLTSLKQQQQQQPPPPQDGRPGRRARGQKTLRVVKATIGRGRRVTLSPKRGGGWPDYTLSPPRLGTASRTSLLDDDDDDDDEAGTTKPRAARHLWTFSIVATRSVAFTRRQTRSAWSNHSPRL